MAKNNVVKMPLSSDPAVFHFRIGGKRYSLRIPQPGNQTGRASAAVVMIDNRVTWNAKCLAAATAGLISAAQNHHVPEDALACGLARDDLPSVQEWADLYFGGHA